MSKKPKAPSFQFYPDEFLTSEKVLMMRPASVAGYVFLLCHAWLSDPPCTLPNHEGTLATLSRLGGDWSMYKEEILKCFVTKGDRLCNERLMRSYLERRKYLDSQSKSGKIGMQRRYADRYNDLSLPVITSSKSPSPSPSPSPSLKTKTPLPPKGEGFDAFWMGYPKKTAKEAALKAWLRLAPDEALRTKISTALAAHRKSTEWLKDGGQFIPYPATWLNQRRWEDELTTRKRPGSLLDKVMASENREEPKREMGGLPDL